MTSRAPARALRSLARSCAAPSARRAASALTASHEDEHHDGTSRPPIKRADEPSVPYFTTTTADDMARDPQLAGLNYPRLDGPLWSHSRQLRPWRRDRFWPAERLDFGETLHESDDTLSTMSVGPYAEFDWRAFAKFYSIVAVVLGGAAFVASGLVTARPLPWTPRVIGPTDFLLREQADTGVSDDE